MKDNKVAKHHFWILLALAVVLIPVVIGGAALGVGTAANKEREKIEGEVKKLANAAVKGQRFIDGLKEQEKTLQEKRGEVWKKAYEDQLGLIKWTDRLSHLDPLYFGDPIQQIDLVTLQNERSALLDEYEVKFPKIIEPTQFLGNNWRVVGYVPGEPTWIQVPSSEDAWLALEDLCVRREILKDISAINRFLSRCLPVPGSPPPVPDLKPPDPKAFENDPEALKTAQAEYAKKKGEYDQKKADYDKLKVDTEKELREYFKPKPGETVGRFISPYWQIDLAVRRSDRKAGEHVFRGRITNKSVRRQNIDKVEFKVFFQDPDDPATQPAMLKLNHEYLAAGETYEFDEVNSTFSAPSLNMVTVEQKLDQKFAPVKRVDRVALCYQSHRYSLNGQTLQMAKFSQPKEGDAAALMGGPPGMPGASSTAGGGVPMGGPPAGFPGGGMGDDRGPGGGMMMNLNYTKNGLLKARYVHMTEQVRRMPIGVVLIVDQMHVQDVVRAFANSRLRFQNTQFHWQRFHGGLGLGNAMVAGGMPGGAPGGLGFGDDRGRGTPVMSGPASRSTGGSSTAGGGGAPPRGEGGYQPPGGPPFGGPFGGSRFGGGAFGGPNWDQQQMPEEGTGNLVELCVYGIASIYEKYPPKQPADAGATPPPMPGAAGDVGGAAPPTTPPGAAPAAATPPMPPGGINPPPAAPPLPAAPPPPAAGTIPPPAGTPPAPPPANNPPPAAPKANNPPPGNPM